MALLLEAELVTVNSTEGVAFGPALLAATGAGEVSSVDQACETAITVTGRTSPDELQSKAYRQGYPIDWKLHPTLATTFPRLVRVTRKEEMA